MKQIKYHGITCNGEYAIRTIILPNQMILDDAIKYVREHNGIDNDYILYYQAFMEG